MTDILSTQSKWFKNSSEGAGEGEDKGAGGGEKKIRRENKVSGPILRRPKLSPDPRSVHYYISKKTDRGNTQAHTHTRTQSQRLMLLSGRGMRPARSGAAWVRLPALLGGRGRRPGSFCHQGRNHRRENEVYSRSRRRRAGSRLPPEQLKPYREEVTAD